MFRQQRDTPADTHAARIAQRSEVEQQKLAADPTLASPRSRLESFRAQQANAAAGAAGSDAALTPRRRLDSFRQMQGQPACDSPATPAIPAGQENKLASTPSIPPLGLSTTGSSASFAAGGGLDSARPLSTRRLKKELLCADSTKAEMSNSAGHVTLTDSQGTPRSVRVVQQQELEDFNMVNVKWVWSFEGKTHQIVLRHGRRSGIRKIYVDKVPPAVASHPAPARRLVDPTRRR